MTITNVQWVETDKIASWTNEDGTAASGLTTHPVLAEWLKTNTPAAAPTVVPPTIDDIYDALLLNQRLLKAVVLALNDGTLTVGGNKTANQLKNIIKAKL